MHIVIKVVSDAIRRFGIEAFHRYYGTYVGIVIDNSQYADRGTLLVSIPDIYGVADTQLTVRYEGFAGKGFGVAWCPANGEAVLVRFRLGNLQLGYWSGSFWAKKETPKNLDKDTTSLYLRDGSYIQHDHKSKTITVKHIDGATIKITTDTIDISKGKNIQLSDNGFKFETSYLSKGPETKTYIEDTLGALDLLLTALAAIPITSGVVAPIKSEVLRIKTQLNTLDIYTSK